MSHFTSVKTKITDKECLVAALEALYPKQVHADGKTKTRGYRGSQRNDEIVCKASKTYDVGISRQPDGTYSFVADWWGIQTTGGVSEEEFMTAVTRRYSYEVIQSEIRKKGWTLEVDEQGVDGQRRVVVSTWRG